MSQVLELLYWILNALTEYYILNGINLSLQPPKSEKIITYILQWYQQQS